MSFNGNFMCTSFKVELIKGMHDFTNGQDAFKIALYTDSAVPTNFGGSGTVMNHTVTNYADSAQVGASGDYQTGGGTALTNTTPSKPGSGTTATTSFATKSWGSATITARGAILYNTQAGGQNSTANAVLVLDFISDKSSSSGNFQINFPANDASNAIIRIA